MQQGWIRFVEMTESESEGEKENGNCFHKKLRSNNLNQHCKNNNGHLFLARWLPFCSSLGITSYQKRHKTYVNFI